MLFVGELVTFTPSTGFNVTTLGQEVTVYEDTMGSDVSRNKATGVKSHIIDIDKKMNRT